jgi:hypothetical protein
VLVKFPGGEALSVAAILEAPGEVVAMGGSEHLLVLGFTNAVSATHRKEWLHWWMRSGERIRVEARLDPLSPLFEVIYGSSWEPTVVLHPGFFTCGAVSGLSPQTWEGIWLMCYPYTAVLQSMIEWSWAELRFVLWYRREEFFNPDSEIHFHWELNSGGWEVSSEPSTIGVMDLSLKRKIQIHIRTCPLYYLQSIINHI